MEMQEGFYLRDNFLRNGFYLGREDGLSLKRISDLPKPDESVLQTLDVRVEIYIPVINTQIQSKGLIKLWDSLPADNFDLSYLHRTPTVSEYAGIYDTIYQLGPFDFSRKHFSVNPQGFLDYMEKSTRTNFDDRLWTHGGDYFSLKEVEIYKKSARLRLFDWVDHIPLPSPFSLKALRMRYRAGLIITFERDCSSVPPEKMENLSEYLRGIQRE